MGICFEKWLILNFLLGFVGLTCTPVDESSSESSSKNEGFMLLEKIRHKNYEDIVSSGNVDLSPVSWSFGLNYSMTLDQMKEKIKNQFDIYKKNNLIMSKDQFKDVSNKYFILGTDNLTRISGAEYLKKKIGESTQLSGIYDVPSFVIVLDDVNNVDLEINFFNQYFPIVSRLNNGYIYFEKIIGSGVADNSLLHEPKLGINSGIGYVDYGDKGNIIQPFFKDKYFIVDTEAKSFDYFNFLVRNPKVANFLSYLKKKFDHLNDYIIDYNFKFNI